MPRTVTLVLAALAAVVALAGCGSSDDADDGGGRTDDVAMSEPAGGLAEGEAAAPADGAADGAGDAKSRVGTPSAQQPAVISTGTVSLEAEDVGRARLRVRTVVDAHQGTVAEQETTTGGKGELTTARLVVRVPSERFDDAVTALEKVATPKGTTTNGEDVSAEIVDVDARIRAQRKSVARIEALLARAESIEQIVAIEGQLATRQADLDALESRQQWLADQTGMSTITVAIEQPPTPHESEEATTGFLGGLGQGWDAFVEALGTVLVVAGFVVPWLVLVVLVALPARLVLRRRSRRPAGATS